MDIEKKQSREQQTLRQGRNDDKAVPNAVQRPMATIQDDDERLLARIGYKQVRPERNEGRLRV